MGKHVRVIVDMYAGIDQAGVMSEPSNPYKGSFLDADSRWDFYRNVLDSCCDRIYVFDRECRYVFVGEFALKMLGLRLCDVVGKHWRELGFPADVMVPVERLARRAMETGLPVVERSPGWGDAVTSADFVVSALRNREDDVIGVVIVARQAILASEIQAETESYRSERQPHRDMTAQSSVAELETDIENWVAQQRLEREATHLHRIVLKSISHDFRSPLAGVLSALAAISEDADPMPPEVTREMAATGLSQARRLERFLDNLLTAAYLEEASLRPNLDDEDPVLILADVLSMCELELRDHQLEWDIEDELPSISVDRALIIQALANVLANATRHTPSGSAIRLLVSADSSTVSYVIEDKGSGIPEALLVGTGSTDVHLSQKHGLGLEIARALVAAHRGVLRLENLPEGGARVSVLIPRSQEEGPFQ